MRCIRWSLTVHTKGGESKARQPTLPVVSSEYSDLGVSNRQQVSGVESAASTCVSPSSFDNELAVLANNSDYLLAIQPVDHNVTPQNGTPRIPVKSSVPAEHTGFPQAVSNLLDGNRNVYAGARYQSVDFGENCRYSWSGNIEYAIPL